MLRLTGRPHYTLWAREIGGIHFKERTGQFFPIYYLDVDVTDAPVESRDPVQVDVRIRLGKHLAADGSVDRIISEAWTEVTSTAADGRPLRLGGTHKQAVFTRPDPDPEKRKVRVLHPSLGLGELPAREIRPFSKEDLLAAPEGFVPREELLDAEAHVWSYQQTDPNGHVHAMDYVRVMEAFAADQLARTGVPDGDRFFGRARVVFRRPCFAGEWYRRRARRFLGPHGEQVLIGSIEPVAGPDDAARGRAATVIQLWQGVAKKSLQSRSR
ncbi:MAG TPA: hotdog fold domain-containing protein [Candidatus Binatia bacterium]|nr:hotdog fold domain-containing protein [Candidatus Binatia bacterium]